MNEIILLKLGEVVLKGLNRRSFEDKLNANIRRRLQHCGSFHVYSKQSTVYVEPQSADCDLTALMPPAGRYSASSRPPGPVPVPRTRTPFSTVPKTIWTGISAPRKPSRWRPSGRTSTSP